MKLLQKKIWEETDEPWGVLVGCILLNRAKYYPASKAWDKMKRFYGESLKMSRANPGILEGTMKELGLQTVRADYLIRMSKAYREKAWQNKMWTPGADASTLPGCGGFARECWNLVVIGDFKTECTDTYLESWRKWNISPQ